MGGDFSYPTSYWLFCLTLPEVSFTLSRPKALGLSIGGSLRSISLALSEIRQRPRLQGKQ